MTLSDYDAPLYPPYIAFSEARRVKMNEDRPILCAAKRYRRVSRLKIVHKFAGHPVRGIGYCVKSAILRHSRYECRDI